MAVITNTNSQRMYSLGLSSNFIISVRGRLNAWTRDDVISCDLEVSGVSGDGFDIKFENCFKDVIIIRDCPLDVYTIIVSVNIFCM